MTDCRNMVDGYQCRRPVRVGFICAQCLAEMAARRMAARATHEACAASHDDLEAE